MYSILDENSWRLVFDYLTKIYQNDWEKMVSYGQVCKFWRLMYLEGHYKMTLNKNSLPDTVREIIQSGIINRLIVSGKLKSQIVKLLLKYYNNVRSLEFTLKFNVGIPGCKSLRELLSKSNTLTKLDLTDNLISDKALEQLAIGLQKNKGLQELILDKNCLGEKGLEELGNALVVNKTLRKLFLRDRTTEQEKDFFPLFDALGGCSSLQELDLSNNNLTLAGIEKLSQALSVNNTLRKLVIRNKNLYNNTYSESIGKIAICLRNMLSLNSGLQELYLEIIAFGNYSIVKLCDGLCKNKTLRVLSLDWLSELESDGIRAIGKILRENKSLTKLRLRKLGNISYSEYEEIVAALSINNSLQELNISRIFFDGETCKKLGKALCSNTTLQKLRLEECLGSLGHFFSTGSLQNNNSLQEIIIKGCNFDNEIIYSSGLAKNKTLRKLVLSRIDICSELLKFLTEVLAENTTLCDLKISGNGSSSFTKDSFRNFCQAITENSGLYNLTLCNVLNKEDIENVRFLGKILQHNRNLLELNLSSNNIGDNEAKELAKYLPENNTLRTLVLKYCNLSTIGITELLRACWLQAQNKHLEIFFSARK